MSCTRKSAPVLSLTRQDGAEGLFNLACERIRDAVQGQGATVPFRRGELAPSWSKEAIESFADDHEAVTDRIRHGQVGPHDYRKHLHNIPRALRLRAGLQGLPPTLDSCERVEAALFELTACSERDSENTE